MKVANLFFKNTIDEQCTLNCPPEIKSIAWFSQILKNENLQADVVNDVLDKMKDFLDQREYEKAEIVAELQLAYAFQNILEEKRVELIDMKILKQ